MLHIHHDETPARSPSKTYADACWAANPRLPSTWWREVLGHTVGKIALDWRNTITQTEHLAHGCNLILASPRTWPAVTQLLNLQPNPQAFITVLETPELSSLPSPHPTYILWQTEGTEDATTRQTALTKLEDHVRQGHIEAYGISNSPLPLHQWLEEAAAATLTIHGRRKRPALRLMQGSLDLLNLALLTNPTTRQRDEPVSPLELAARLGLLTLITNPVLPNPTPPSPAALAALTQAAEAENTLNHHLGGWPQSAGQPLFSILAHLAVGQAPWPTPHHWQRWHTQLWPVLQTQWQLLAVEPRTAAVTAYLAALQNLLPHGPSLAAAAAQPLLEVIHENLHPKLPTAWKDADAQTLTLGILASIPGIGAVAVAEPLNLAALQQRDDIPDPGALFLSPSQSLQNG